VTEWLDLARMLFMGVGVSIPIGGLMIAFRRERVSRFDLIAARFDRGDVAHAALAAKIEKLGADFDGLTAQIRASDRNNERRFVIREEYAAGIERVESQLAILNGHLFELAKVGKGRGT